MDVVKFAARALEPISAKGIPVQEGWYDEAARKLHVSLWPLQDAPQCSSDDYTEVERASIQITIFSTEENEDLRAEIVKLMQGAGACYTGTDQRQTRQESGVYIRPLRFDIYQEKERME